MIYESALPVLLPLTFSYLLTYYSAKKLKSRTLTTFLFSGNRPTLAISSSLGSVFSLSIAGTALISAGFVYGWQIVFPLAAGAISGTLVLISLQRSAIYQSFAPRDEGTPKMAGISYLACLANKLGHSFHVFFSSALLALYFMMLVMELSVLRVLLERALSFDPFDLGVLVATLSIISFCYVYIGGYRGVLLTDHFQLAVILLFFALLFANSRTPEAIKELPGPTTALINWDSGFKVAILHLSVFAGSFCFTASSVDHWNRTLGTLSQRQARLVLIQTALLASLAAVVLVLIGSYATRLDIPENISNAISLELTTRALAESNLTLRFVLLMALTCIVLTTIDTYMISMQQLYYEMSVRIHVTSHRLYLIEWALKWPQVRSVGGLIAAAALLTSFMVEAQAIYFFGVLTLSGWTFFLPVIATFFLPPSCRFAPQALRRGLTLCFILSLLLFIPLLLLTNAFYEPVALHLYLICGTALCAVLASIGIVLSVCWLLPPSCNLEEVDNA